MVGTKNDPDEVPSFPASQRGLGRRLPAADWKSPIQQIESLRYDSAFPTRFNKSRRTRRTHPKSSADARARFWPAQSRRLRFPDFPSGPYFRKRGRKPRTSLKPACRFSVSPDDSPVRSACIAFSFAAFVSFRTACSYLTERSPRGQIIDFPFVLVPSQKFTCISERQYRRWSAQSATRPVSECCPACLRTTRLRSC